MCAWVVTYGVVTITVMVVEWLHDEVGEYSFGHLLGGALIWPVVIPMAIFLVKIKR